MKDIPVFTTEYGVASLGLQQIPLRKQAYVRIQAVTDLSGLVEECVSFCRACGAEQVFAAGHEGLSQWPLETVIRYYAGQKVMLPPSTAFLWPVLTENVSAWREIYNRKMAGVSHAALLSAFDEAELVESGGCYFVHRNGTILGIGRVDEDVLSAVAAEVPGAGEEIVSALASAMFTERIRLEVASNNLPAVRLYERLGFLQIGEGDRWYRIF